MAQFTVRNLEDDIKDRLKRRAARHGYSMEEEARQILRNALKDEDVAAVRLGSRIAARFAKHGLDEDLQEQRGEVARPMRYRK